MNLTRPHPFKDGRICQYGCPWHGFMSKKQLLDEPGGTLKATLPSWAASPAVDGGGSTIQLKVPGLPAVARTPAEQARDTQNGHEWLNYALIAGRTLHGHDIGDRIIYIDPAGTPWSVLVETLVLGTNEGWQLRATLECAFGRIAHNPYPAINRQLDELSATPAEIDAGQLPVYPLVGTGSWLIEQNSTGSVSYLHAYSTDSTDYAFEIRESIFSNNVGLAMRLVGVMRLELSGTGSLDRATLGDGISGTLTLYKTGPECYVQRTNITGVTTADWGPPYEPEGDWWEEYFHYQDPAVGEGYDKVVYGQSLDPPGCSPDVTNVWKHKLTDAALNVPTKTATGNEREGILRCCFDPDTDGEVILSMRSAGYTQERDIVTTLISDYTRTWVDTYEQPEGFEECQFVGIEEYYSGSTTAIQTFERASSTSVKLLRNGVEKTELLFETISEMERTPTTNPTAVATRVELNGEPYTETTEFRKLTVQSYCPQVFGLKARSSAAPDPEAWARLYSVITPWGSDSTHDGLRISGPARYLYGTHDPVKKLVHWYEQGVTDQIDTEVNFV